MDNVIQKVETTPNWNPEQVTLITNTVAKGATNDELKLFLYTCSRTGLDPLTRQIFFVKRAGQMTIQTGIDGYRAIAERTGELAGIEDAVFDSEEDINPKKATVTVYRLVNGQRVPFTASARWTEYAPTGSQGFMWQKMPYLMLAKCAESLALRKAFPNNLSGLYTSEEMSQADNIPTQTQSYSAQVVTTPLQSKLEHIEHAEEMSEEEIIQAFDDLGNDAPFESKKPTMPKLNSDNCKECGEKKIMGKNGKMYCKPCYIKWVNENKK